MLTPQAARTHASRVVLGDLRWRVLLVLSIVRRAPPDNMPLLLRPSALTAPRGSRLMTARASKRATAKIALPDTMLQEAPHAMLAPKANTWRPATEGGPAIA